MKVSSSARRAQHALAEPSAPTPASPPSSAPPATPASLPSPNCAWWTSWTTAAVAALAAEVEADLVVVGPERRSCGRADPVARAGIAVFGPSKARRAGGVEAFAKE